MTTIYVTAAVITFIFFFYILDKENPSEDRLKDALWNFWLAFIVAVACPIVVPYLAGRVLGSLGGALVIAIANRVR